jgi:hypothetical protein
MPIIAGLIAGAFALVLVSVLAVVAVALAVKVLPFLLIGWVGVKVVQQLERRPAQGMLSQADQRWLDSRV